MNALPFQALAETFTGHILNSLLEGGLLLLAVWLLLRIAGRPNSKTRFTIWFLALIVIALLPLAFGVEHSAALLSRGSAAFTLSAGWAFCFLAVWCLGVTIGSMRLVAGILAMRRLHKRSEPIEYIDTETLTRIQTFCAPRRVGLYQSKELLVPAALGLGSPAIVIPENLVGQLSPEQLEVVLLHEAAHLRRWDDWTNLAQKMIKVLFFFHPAVWWVESRLTLEREMACDDLVLAQKKTAKAYAQLLVSFAEKVQQKRGLVLVHGLVSRVGQLSLRVAEVLDAKRPAGTHIRKSILGTGVALLAICGSAACFMPQIVGFESRRPVASASSAVRERFRPASTSIARSGPKMIPAAYQMPSATMTTSPVKKPLRKTKRNEKRKEMSTPRQVAVTPALIVLQRTDYNLDDAGVFTICVWTVGNGETSTSSQTMFVLQI